MRNIWLTIGYLCLIGLVVASRESFIDSDWVVVGVAAGVLFLGLALWVYIAQSHRQ